MSSFHMFLGIAVLLFNGAAGAWGATAWLRSIHSVWFWYLLRLAQGTVAAQVIGGLILLARGETAPDGLHIVYGVSPLLVTLFSEGLRAGAALRELEGVDDVDSLSRPEQIAIARKVARAEMGVMTIGALLIVTLALRAYQTGGR